MARASNKGTQAGFLPCLCFKVTAENTANYLTKGSKVGVTGSIQTSTWEKDGVKHYKTEILANHVEFMDSKPKVTKIDHLLILLHPHSATRLTLTIAKYLSDNNYKEGKI